MKLSITHFFLLIIVLYWIGCTTQTIIEYKYIRKNPLDSKVVPSFEGFYNDKLKSFSGKKVALVTNPSGIGNDPSRIIKSFQEHSISLEFLVGLEHGLLGLEEYFGKEPKSIDPEFQKPVYHIYKIKTEELKEILAPIDVLIFDVQDMGMRCYTYITVLKRIMDNLNANQELVILDHISPGMEILPKGDFLTTENINFAGEFPSPLITGMSMGEAALFYNGEYLEQKVKLQVIPVKNYKRGMIFEETGLFWNTPSPNLPNLDSARNYMALVLLEGVNVSVGRGTQAPFVYFGAKWMTKNKEIADELNKLSKDYFFQTVYFKPAFGPFAGEICRGLRMNLVKVQYDPIELGYQIIELIKKHHPEEFAWRGSTSFFVDKLWGSDTLRNSINQNVGYKTFSQNFLSKEKNFYTLSKKYYIY